MTSVSLSLADRIKNRKKYINRTLWTSLVAFPIMAAYYVLGVIMMVSRSINYARIYHQADKILHHEKLKAVSMIMGFEQMGVLIVGAIALAFAFQGFSYVFSQSRMDFYLSQPTTRRQRMFTNYINAITTFLGMYVISVALGLIAAAVMGALNHVVLISVLLASLRNLLFFIVVYNIAVMSVLLSGSLPIAMILTAFFSFFTFIYEYVFAIYKRVFFATYSYMSDSGLWFSPFYDMLITIKKGASLRNYDSYNESMDTVKEWLRISWKADFDLILLVIITFIFVEICGKLRKTEWAGKSIALKPCRWFVKISVCLLAGLSAGAIVYYIYQSVWSNTLIMMMSLFMLIACIATGMVCEIVLDSNIRSAFRGKAQTLMAVALMILIFVIFKGDLLGFDSYVPAPEKIESCSVIDDSYYYSAIDMDDGENADFMKFTDTKTFTEFARIGMKAQKTAAKTKFKDVQGYSLNIKYRLKSGREVYRCILIPYDTDKELMNRVLDSEEFIRGFFICFNDETVRKADTDPDSREVVYRSFTDNKTTKNLPYAELSDAYRQDLLDNFSFSYMKDHLPIGTAEYTHMGYRYYTVQFPVYETFTRTLELLKKYEIYSDSTLNLDEVREVKVVNYYPGYDLEVTDIDDISGDLDSVEKIYTDEAQIKEIVEGAVCTEYYNQWYDYSRNNDQYNIIVNRTGEFRGNDYAGTYYTFLKGSVPEFVISDTN
ncbi:MAG: hypothetical protein K6G10_04355 [Butyrivibrio sp.]|nr:hypothetical protein [Butyrivibrio sp.]